MIFDDVNKWLVALANIGVLAGFMLVAYQLNLNTEAIRLQVTVGMTQQQNAGELAFMGETTHEAFSIAMLDPAALTDAQIGQMWAYLGVGLNSNQNLWRAYETGFINEEELDGIMALNIPNYLSSEFGLIYWKAVIQNYPSAFVNNVDAVIANNPDALEEQYRVMLEGVRNLRGLGSEP
jgi:hypothetical protein